MKKFKFLKESMMSQAKQFMKSTSNDVRHAAQFHVRSKGKSLETNKVSANSSVQEAKINPGDSNRLKLLKLQNLALRAMPSSPRQKQIQKEIAELREKMKKAGEKEYHQLEEGVTGPTRMQLQNHFDRTHGSLRARIYNTEKAHGVYDIQVNSKGDIIHFKQTPHHEPAHYHVSHASGNMMDAPLHENFDDPTTNKFHKVLTKHGWGIHNTKHDASFGSKVTEHVYKHPEHGKSSVTVLRFHSGGSDSWHHHHEQTNGIIGPYGSGETKPGLDKHLGKIYGTKSESAESWIIKEAFQKAKDKKNGFPPKNDNEKDNKEKGFPPRDDPDKGDSNDSGDDAPKDKNSDLKNDADKEDAIKLSGKKEKFNDDPKIEPLHYMSGQGVTNV